MSSSSSSSACAVQRVNVRACVFDEYGAAKNGSIVTLRLVMPPPGVSAFFTEEEAEYTSVGGEVLMENLFQGAWYDIWRGIGNRFRFFVPYTSATEIGIDPVIGNDTIDPCF